MSNGNEIAQLTEIQKGLKDVNAALQTTSGNYLSLVETIVKGNQVLKDNKVSFDNLKKAQTDVKGSTETLDKLGKQVATSEEKLIQLSDKRSKKLTENKRLITEKNKSLKEEEILNNKSAGTLEKLAASNRKLQNEKLKLNLETKKGQKRLIEINKEQDKNNKITQQSSNVLQKQKINIGNYGSALGGLSPTLARSTSGIQTFSKSLLALLANPIVAIVAAIVAVFAGLVAVFKSTDDGGTKLKALFAAFTIIFDVLKRRAVILIEAFRALFSGKFRESAELFKKAVTGIGEEIANATVAAHNYEMALDAINDRQIAFISEIANTRNAIEKLIQLSKDQTKSDTERLTALDKAIKLEEELSQMKVKLATAELENELDLAATKANIDKDTLRDFIALNEEEQTATRQNNKEIAAAWNVLSDDVIKTLEEMYAKAIDADTEFFRRTQRSISLRSGLEKKLAINNTKTLIANLKLQEKAIVKSQEGKGDILLDFSKEEEKLLDKDVQNYIDGEVKKPKKTKEEADKRLKEEEKVATKKKEVGFEAARATTEIFFNSSIQRLDDELRLLDQEKQAKLAGAEGNAEELERINRTFDDKANKIRTEQAKKEKQAALTQAIINTAEAVTKALPNVPLSLLAGSLGAIQIAKIIATRIPKFHKGVNSSPSEFIAGDKPGGGAARELMFMANGSSMMVNKPTYFKGNKFKGATIKNNAETEAIMKHQQASGNNINFDTIALQKANAKGFRDLRRTFINTSIRRNNRAISQQYIDQFL